MPHRATVKFRSDSEPKVITFDCSGTLLQCQEVLLGHIAAILAVHGRDGAAAPAILDAFSAQGRRLTAETPHRLYRNILRAGFVAAAA